MLLHRFSGWAGVAIGGLLLIACLVTALLVAQPGRAAGTEQGPVAEYSFDEGTGTTVEDVTGDGHTATIHGAEWTTHGKYGGAMKFDGGEGEYLSVPDSSELDFEEEFTLEAWVRPSTVENFYAPVIDKLAGGGGHTTSFSYGLYAGDWEHHPFGEVENPLGSGHSVTAPGAIEARAWTHLALTFDGAEERLYVDGELVDETAAEPPVTTEGELEIGAETEHGDFLDGRIDEVRIYDRALSGAEVAADMEAPIETPEAGPVAAWSFDEGGGTTAEDVTGDGHTATIEGAEWAKGKYGDGLKFDGEESTKLSVPYSPEFHLSEEFTLEAWVRPESASNEWASIVAQEGDGESPPHELTWYLFEGGWNTNEPFGGTEPVHGEETIVGAHRALPVDAWSHVAITWDGALGRLYLDGELVEEAPVSPPPLTEGGLQIGDHYDGRLDELRIYDRALSGAEVAADMEAAIQTPKAGPVAAYSFDEGSGSTVEDVTGDGHTATIEGAEWARGKYGDGLRFDSSEDLVKVPSSPEFDLTEEMTLEAWVRPESESEKWATVVGRLGEGEEPAHDPSWYLFEGGPNLDEPIGGTETVDREETYVAAGRKLPLDAWSHLAFTWNGVEGRIYVDGELVEEGAVGPPAVTEGELRIGALAKGSYHFVGRLDELRLYDRALTGAEVDTDMEAPIQTPKQGPVAAWSFDEGEGTTAEDVTGDGHTATIEGAKWTEHGRYGGAMEFDAAEEDVLKIPASEELDFNEEFTLEAWVRPSGGDNHHAPLIDKQEGSGRGYFLYEGGKVSDRPYGAASEEQEFVHAEEPLPAGAWSHVALAFSGNRTYLYVDGQLVDNGAAEPTITSEGELEIGGSTDTSDWFDGRIDEVRIYNRGLDATEIDADMEVPIQTPKQGPIAAWSFEEGEGSTVEDVTGDGHEGTIEGAEWARGKYGKALKFDGEGDVVKVPNSPEFDLTEAFTMEAWVRPESESNEWAPILAKEMGGGEAATELAWWLYEGDWNPNEPYGGTEPLPGEEDDAAAHDPLPVDVWSHVALTYDGAQVRLYVDGELVDCSPVPAGAPPVTEGELQIGAATEHGDYFKGRIDEARVYNRALNEAEIKAAMVPLPEVGTAEPYGVEDTEAVLTATVNPRGDETSYKFQYGPTKGYGTVVPEEPEEVFVGDEPLEVEEVAEELLPETTYHYRVVAHSDAGTIVGPDQTLTTGPEVSPEEEEGEEAEFHALAKKSWKGFFNLAWSGKSYETKDELNMVEKAGATTFRYPFGEPNAVSDKVFEEAAKNHIRILPDLGGNRMEAPNGKGERPGWLKGVREDLERYGSSGTFWTSHPGVPKLVPEYWEIWNEENYGKNGNSSGQVDPVQFADLLRETHELFEKTDASAKIMLGGLLTVSKEENGPAHLTVGSFLHELNKAGGSSYYQAVSLHPYAFKGDVQTISKQVMKNIKKGRHALNSIGGGSKKIWVTEIGWPVGHGDKLHIPVSEKKQKELLESVFSRIKEHAGSGPKGLGIEKAFYYNVQNNSYGEPKDWATYCGLREDVATVHPTPESTKPTPEHGKYREAWYAFQEEAESEFAGKIP